MLALPQVNDQHKVAKRIVSMQLGMAVDIKELSAEMLRTYTDKIMEDRKIKENCIQISQEMKDYTKPMQVVQKLEEYTKTWRI